MVDLVEVGVEAPALEQRAGLDVRTIAEAALLLDVTVLLVLLRVFLPIPVVQGFLAFVCPVPFVLLALRRGSRACGIASVAAYLLLSTLVGPVFAIPILVYGGLGLVFAWASRRRLHRGVTIVIGAALYGLLYLLPPFLFGLFVLRIDLAKVLHGVHRNADSLLKGLGHVHLLSVPVSAPLVALLSRIAPGRLLLDLLHGAAQALLTHPLAALVAFFALYSLAKVWVSLAVCVEVFRLMPAEARRDARGDPIDFLPVR